MKSKARGTTSSRKDNNRSKASSGDRKTNSFGSGAGEKKSGGRGPVAPKKDRSESSRPYAERRREEEGKFGFTERTSGKGRPSAKLDSGKFDSGKSDGFDREKKSNSGTKSARERSSYSRDKDSSKREFSDKKFFTENEKPKRPATRRTEKNDFEGRRKSNASDDFYFEDEFASGRKNRSNDRDDWNFGKDEFAAGGKSKKGKNLEIQKAINKGIDGARKPLRRSSNDLSEGLKSFQNTDDESTAYKPRTGSSRYQRDDNENRKYKSRDQRYEKPGKGKSYGSSKKNETLPDIQNDDIRLNRYLSLAGICSRRDADAFIKAGAVTVNGKVVVEMGYKVKPGDEVVYGGLGIRPEKPVYLLLNKPKDYITTSDDPQNRKTVLQLIEGACKERVYPVGRLDRNTTGLLLFTNDGEMAKKLTHPSSLIQKMYHVVLDKPLSAADKQKISEGITLEDGPVKVDEINYVDTAGSKKEVGVLIHSGRNRIIRRIFEHLGYAVVKLDRVMFAGLTKKDLPKGKWRMITRAELNLLKML